MVASNPRTTAVCHCRRAGCHCRLARQCPTANRSGFTLVELLTVIVIIGILAGLVTAAAVHATGTARQFTITNEIAQLGMALEQYKIRFGDYPPDFAGVRAGDPAAKEAVINHIKRAFPRYRITGDVATQWTKLETDCAACGVNINQLGPESALVFWLGGPPSGGSTRLAGFSANPANPFILGGSRLDPLFEFDETRLGPEPTTGALIYIPPHVRHPSGGTTPPYVYFRAKSNAYPPPAVANYTLDVDTGTCIPYASYVDANGTHWINPKTYQIISSGRDGIYTTLTLATLNCRYLRTDQNNITIEEDDNLTSFATGRLEDMVE